MNLVSFVFSISALINLVAANDWVAQKLPAIHRWDKSSLLKQAQRRDICTIVLAGALWDLHFKHFIEGKLWKQFSDSVSDMLGIQHGYIIYSGSPGYDELPRIDELSWDYTIGSYDLAIFRGGKTLASRYHSMQGVVDILELTSNKNSLEIQSIVNEICSPGNKREL